MRHQCIFNHKFNDRRVPKHLMVALFNVTPAIHGDVIALENGSFDVTQAFNAFVQRIRERFGTPADGAVVAATECILKCFDQHPDAVAAYPSKYARLGKIDHAKRAARMKSAKCSRDAQTRRNAPEMPEKKRRNAQRGVPILNTIRTTQAHGNNI